MTLTDQSVVKSMFDQLTAFKAARMDISASELSNEEESFIYMIKFFIAGIYRSVENKDNILTTTSANELSRTFMTVKELRFIEAERKNSETSDTIECKDITEDKIFGIGKMNKFIV